MVLIYPVVVWLARLLHAAEIAEARGTAEGTVKAHMHAIFKVLGVSNRTQAVIRYGATGQNIRPAGTEPTATGLAPRKPTTLKATTWDVLAF